VPFEDQIGTLAELRDEGIIRHIGLSNVSVEQFRAAQGITEIAAVTAHYNVSDRTGATLLAAAEADGVAFSPWYPTAVAEQGGPSSHIAAVLDPLREKYRASMPQLAIAWLLHRSPVMLPIPGTSSPEHFEENLRLQVATLGDVEQLGVAVGDRREVRVPEDDLLRLKGLVRVADQLGFVDHPTVANGSAPHCDGGVAEVSGRPVGAPVCCSPCATVMPIIVTTAQPPTIAACSLMRLARLDFASNFCISNTFRHCHAPPVRAKRSVLPCVDLKVERLRLETAQMACRGQVGLRRQPGVDRRSSVQECLQSRCNPPTRLPAKRKGCGWLPLNVPHGV